MPSVSFARFEAEILELYSPPFCKKATTKQVKQVLREFRELPGVKRTGDLGPVAIARWVQAHPDRSAVTIESLLRCFGALMTYAVGRRVEYYDMPTVRAIVRDAEANGNRMSSFILGVVNSPAFRTAKADATTTEADPEPPRTRGAQR